MLTGNAADYTTLPKQTTLLTNQAAAALKDMKEADEHEKSEQIVKKIMELVKKDKTITREALAGQVYLSPDYMAKIFKKETGTTINDFIRQERINFAKRLLKQTNLPVTMIAQNVGYNSMAYFSSTFRALTGCTPREYRSSHEAL